MGTKLITGQPEIGRVWTPAETRSYRGGGAVTPVHHGIVVASVRRPKLSIAGTLKGLLPDIPHPKPGDFFKQLDPFRHMIDPKLFATELIWASITHNERVDRGASIQHNRCWGTIGQAANGVITAVAVATTGFTVKTKTDLSIGVIGSGVTTNEFTTIGLSRAAGAPQNLGAAPGALDGAQAGDIFKSFSVTGSGTAHGSALFDQVAVASSNLYCEDIYSSDASVVNLDTLQNTWTVTF